jgi:transporter family protein
MNWFLIALASPLLWSFCNHIDKILLDKYYQNVRAGSLMFMTSLMSLLMAAGIFVVKPSLVRIPTHDALLILAAGVIYFLAIFPYLYALSRDEASRVIPLFQVQPFFSFLLGYIFLHEHLSAHQMIAGLIIVAGSILISLDMDDSFRIKKSVLILMMLSTLFFATEALIFKFVGLRVGFWSAAFYQDAGCFIAGLVLFSVAPSFRNGFLSVLRRSSKPVLISSFLNESFNVIARMIFNYATLLAPLALVTLVSGTQPLFVLIIGIVLTMFWPRLSQESLLRRHLAQKIAAIIITFGGTYLLLK